MSDALQRAVDRLSRIPGVRGAQVVDARAGVAVTAELTRDVPDRAVAALAASTYRRAVRTAEEGGFGALEMLQVDAADGYVIVAGAGDLLVVVLAEPDAQLGRVGVEARRTAEAIE